MATQPVTTIHRWISNDKLQALPDALWKAHSGWIATLPKTFTSNGWIERYKNLRTGQEWRIEYSAKPRMSRKERTDTPIVKNVTVTQKGRVDSAYNGAIEQRRIVFRANGR